MNLFRNGGKMKLPLSDIIEEMRKIFVTRERYDLEVPQLKQIVYGGIGLIVLSVISAWITLVVKTK